MALRSRVDPLLDGLPCGLLSVHKDGRILSANKTLADYLAVPVPDLVGTQIASILSNPSRIFYETHLYPQLRMQGYLDECYLTLLRPDGHELPVLVNASPKVGQSTDVSDMALVPVPRRHQLEAELIEARRQAQTALAAEEEANRLLESARHELEARQQELTALNNLLESQAIRDDLTGLYNRRHFRLTLALSAAQAKKNGSHLSLLLLDLDHFKTINDRFGHPTGDEVLRRVSATFLEVARSGEYVCRYGGEEFAIVLPNTSTEQAYALSQRLLEAVSQLQFRGFGVTVSIGLSGSPPLEPDPGRIVAAADQSLYKAKRSGRNRVVQHKVGGVA